MGSCEGAQPLPCPCVQWHVLGLHPRPVHIAPDDFSYGLAQPIPHIWISGDPLVCGLAGGWLQIR